MRIVGSTELAGINANDGVSFEMEFAVPAGFEIVAVADWISSAWEIAITKASIIGRDKLSMHAYNCNSATHDTVITVSVLCANNVP